MDSKSKERQVIKVEDYTIWEEANGILASLGLSTEQKWKDDTVQDHFDGYFIKRQKPIFERAKFNLSRQEEGKSMDSFATVWSCRALWV